MKGKRSHIRKRTINDPIFSNVDVAQIHMALTQFHPVTAAQFTLLHNSHVTKRRTFLQLQTDNAQSTLKSVLEHYQD